MKILFVRHGESVDDIENRYGGWSDYALTQRGKDQVVESAKYIHELNEKFQLVLSSPLKRAVQTAQIIASQLQLELKIFEYVKERNTYGILSGMVKDEAKIKYPDQVNNLEEDNYVIGSERYEDTIERVKMALGLLKKMKLENIIVVTHGVFLKHIFEISGKKLTKKEDGAFVL